MKKEMPAWLKLALIALVAGLLLGYYLVYANAYITVLNSCGRKALCQMMESSIGPQTKSICLCNRRTDFNRQYIVVQLTSI